MKALQILIRWRLCYLRMEIDFSFIGNHALGFASVPMKSSSNNEIPSFSAITMTFNTSAPVAHAADQTNASKVLQSWKMAQPMTETIMTSADDNKASIWFLYHRKSKIKDMYDKRWRIKCEIFFITNFYMKGIFCSTE